MAAPLWQKGIVTKIEDETYNTKRFWIEFPEVVSFDFKPGQFVTIDLPLIPYYAQLFSSNLGAFPHL